MLARNKAAAIRAARRNIDKTGYGGYVSDDIIRSLVDDVLKAIDADDAAAEAAPAKE